MQILPVRNLIMTRFQPRLYRKETVVIRLAPCYTIKVSTDDKIFTVSSCLTKSFSFKYENKEQLNTYLNSKDFITKLESILV